MHRFYVEQPLEEGNFVLLDDGIVSQVSRVLKLKAGEEIELFSDDERLFGWNFTFQITRLQRNGIEGRIISRAKNDREPKISLTLFQSVLKKDNMEWIFQKATEIGVTSFVPVLTERSVKTGINEERAKKIIKEAAEQSGRAMFPHVHPVLSFQDALGMTKEYQALNIVAHEKESGKKLEGLPFSGSRIHLFIGPEGGFSDAEVEMARNQGFFIVLLSRRILRAETAAITASYFLLHRFGY